MSKIYLALGTNLGQRERNLQVAIDALGSYVAVERISSVYETEPWGIRDQPDFLNICLAGQTNLTPRALLHTIKDIEKRQGREDGPRYGPRLIDIDVLFLDDLIETGSDLILPHPRIGERAFVLAPLLDIAPELRHPITNDSIKEMAAKVDMGTVRKIPKTVFALKRPVNLAWGIKTYVMGIINATPDSFSGDGLIQNGNWIELALKQAIGFVEAGADLLDIGGESTRPGGTPISAEIELERILPVVRAIRREVDVPISIDTYRADVAKAALENGADWVNDVWALRMDPSMVDLVARVECPVIIMHNRSKPKNVHQEEILGGRYVGISYESLMEDVSRELMSSVELALSRGVDRRNIIIDPGIGFGKTVNQNLRLINELTVLKDLGFPILVGPSRKSFIGYTLNLPPEERVEGTAAAVVIAIDRGADIVRVHDVHEIVRVVAMADKIIRSGSGT